MEVPGSGGEAYVSMLEIFHATSVHIKLVVKCVLGVLLTPRAGHDSVAGVLQRVAQTTHTRRKADASLANTYCCVTLVVKSGCIIMTVKTLHAHD